MQKYLLTVDQAHALADVAGDRSGSIHDFIQGEGPFGGLVGVISARDCFSRLLWVLPVLGCIR